MKDKIVKLLKNKYFITCIITLLIYNFYLMIYKIFPFGENTILKNDQYTQYVNFLCYYKDILLGKESIQLSWYMGLGTNFYTTFTYYLASPINIISIFFNANNMYICVEIIILIKILFISNFMLFYIKKIFKIDKIIAISFSIMYAFSAYVISYSFNIMWIDSLYMLPIIAYMIEKYIENKKFIGYVISLSIALFINYYIGYMLIIFSFIYFLSKYILREEKIKIKFKYIIKFFAVTVLSISISSITILPSIMQVIATADFNNNNIQIFLFDILKIKMLSNQLFNNYSSYVSNITSNFFCGTLTTLSILLYMFNKKIEMKEKIIFIFVIIFMILPIFSPILNKIWHGMTIANGYGYRFSFITSFFLIYISLRNFENIRDVKKKDILLSIIILTVITIMEIISTYTIPIMNFYVSLIKILIAYICVLIFEVLILLFVENEVKWKRKIICIFMISAVIIDITLSLYKDEVYPSRYYTIEEYNEKDNIVEYVKSKLEDTKLQRIDFILDNGCENIGSKYKISTIQYFTSARNLQSIENFYNLGYNAHKDIYLWLTSKSGNCINYSLIGSKYYILKDNIQIPYGLNFVEEYDGYKIYENKNAFNIAYMVLNKYEHTDEKNCFEFQKNILRSFDNSKDYIYKIEAENKVLNSKIETKNNIKNIIIKAKDDITICIDTNTIEYLKLGKDEIYKNTYKKGSQEGGIKQIAHMKKGEQIEIFIKEYNDQLTNLYAINNKEVEETLNKIKENNQIRNIKIKKDSLEISETYIKEGYLVFAIPYDKGWKAYVDNKEVEIKRIYEAFMKIDIQESGLYNVKLKYQVPYLKISCIISSIGTIILLVCLIKNKGEM